MPAMVLADLERRADRPVASLFDLIAGTSTGGIIALGLACPGADARPAWRAEQLVDVYEHEGDRIFDARTWQRIHGLGGMIHEKYSAAGLERVLERLFGHVCLTEALTQVLIPAYDVVERRPFYFDSAKAQHDPAEDYEMKVAARATSAAPTYFEPREHAASRRVFVDGGLYANNPGMCAFAEAQAGRFGNGEILLVSLGTGEMTRQLPYAQIREWGVAQWARPILHLVLDGVSMAIDHQLAELLRPGCYWRFQSVLTQARDDLDDARPENIAQLKAQASNLISARAAELEEVAERLSSDIGGHPPSSGKPA